MPAASTTPIPLWRCCLAVLALVVAGCAGGPRAADDVDAVADEDRVATAPDDAGGDGDDADADDRADADEQASDPGGGGVEGGFERLDGTVTTSEVSDGDGLDRWLEAVPDVEEVSVPRADGTRQPALWLPPDDDGGVVPLLVVLHSFSYGYTQHDGIPFARWADSHGWAMIHPDFGGAFRNPESNGSDQAVADVADAVAYALEDDAVDPGRVYAIGFSGGGQMSLLAAARHPDLLAGAVSFGPVYDLVDWFRYNLDGGNPAYAFELERACGGDLRTDRSARRECRERSPSAHLDDLADADVPVYLGHGLRDDVVPPSDSARAFNQLAEEDDRLSDDEVEALARRKLPDGLRGDVEAEHHFTEDDPDVAFARRSGDAVLVLFDGGHEFVVHPGLRWLFELAGGTVET